MKKSTITLLIAITGIFLCFTVVNLKLKSEYNAGRIQSPMKTNILPVFHHIKEINVFPKETNIQGNSFFVVSRNDSSALVHDYYNFEGLTYYVKNDTLYLEQDSISMNYKNIAIYCKELRSIHANISEFTITQNKTDSLLLFTHNTARILYEGIPNNYLKIKIEDQSRIIITSKDTITKANITISQNGSLKAADIYFKEKMIIIKDSATIELSGKSIQNFGVMTDTKN